MILTINIQTAAVKMYSIKAKGILKISHRYAKKKNPLMTISTAKRNI